MVMTICAQACSSQARMKWDITTCSQREGRKEKQEVSRDAVVPTQGDSKTKGGNLNEEKINSDQLKI